MRNEFLRSSQTVKIPLVTVKFSDFHSQIHDGVADLRNGRQRLLGIKRLNCNVISLVLRHVRPRLVDFELLALVFFTLMTRQEFIGLSTIGSLLLF